MNIINNNPYRILGVFANSPRKDYVANKGKATAFLKVNRPVEFPLDLKGLLSVPNRTLDLMNEAEARLAIAKEQIKYAQFWFIHESTSLDDLAFKSLFSGNMAEAINTWSEKETIKFPSSEHGTAVNPSLSFLTIPIRSFTMMTVGAFSSFIIRNFCAANTISRDLPLP